ncbi:replication initiation negative regulator SeqA [Alishewanella tabrizica]|uniref:Negative modulator of initiation of replication n=1 Tax=Alishewanella tabrizica TaxID=671278 RepID=A0ABQ2WRU7_9ALTE|nr:replication initiation negative regulator SeqA [Alishewanella tabrizica]GGW67486.1 negative modulator of initiation of replication [Alishewanella tabrizica]
MKTIEIDDDLYQYIAGQTLKIGESASDILRRLLPGAPVKAMAPQPVVLPIAPAATPANTANAANAATSLAENTVTVNTETTAEPSMVNASKAGNIFDLVTPADLQAEHNIVGRFLYLLSVLARVHKKQFHKVLDIKGRNRLYFGNSAAELSETGTSTNPKQIPNTAFWVITNSNTTRKKMMLTETAIKLGYSAEDAERIRDLL